VGCKHVGKLYKEYKKGFGIGKLGSDVKGERGSKKYFDVVRKDVGRGLGG
jgi:hypothetical protein